MEQLLTDRDLALMIRRARSTLQKDRVAGFGPPFVRVGHFIRYRPQDVAAWLAQRESHSTSDR